MNFHVLLYSCSIQKFLGTNIASEFSIVIVLLMVKDAFESFTFLFAGYTIVVLIEAMIIYLALIFGGERTKVALYHVGLNCIFNCS